MKAVIMAGGEGSRLRPLTCNRPKPMVPVLDRPVMAYAIDLLKRHGITQIAVTLQYMPEVIKEYFGDGSRFGVELHYFVEETPLGTAGSVRNAASFLDQTFLVISGDALTDINLREAVSFHRATGALATLVLSRVDCPLEYGVVVAAEDGRIIRFLEKPGWSEVFSDTVNTGIYVLEPEVFSYYAPERFFDFSKDLFPLLLRENKPLYGVVMPGYWCDIGNVTAYLDAQRDFLAGKINLPIPGKEIGEKCYVGEETRIDPAARIEGPVFIGSRCEVEAGALVAAYSVLGRGCIVQPHASIKRSVLWENVYVGRRAALRGAVICSRVQVHARAAVYEGAVIGDESTIKEGGTLKPEVKLWPCKLVETGTTVNRSIVWGTRLGRAIFGNQGVTGLVNAEISPEFAATLGAAFASSLGGGCRVVVSCDGHPASRMLERAIVSGLLSGGAAVQGIGQGTTPMHRFAVRSLGAAGGAHVKVVAVEPEKVNILLTDGRGADISRSLERKIENLMAREDFARADAAGIKEAGFAPGIHEAYVGAILHGLDLDNLRRANFTLCGLYEPENLQRLIEPLCREAGVTLQWMGESNGDSGPRAESCVNLCSCLAETVVQERANAGFILSADGEKMVLIDNLGRVIEDDRFVALIALYILKTRGGPVIAPVTAPRAIETMAVRYGARVIRTKAAARDFINAVAEHGGAEFMPYLDPLHALFGILNYLAQHRIALSDLVDEIPSFYLARKSIPVGWNYKGRVIRELVQEKAHDPASLELIDGVKVFHPDGWALVLPDPETPVCRVLSEGTSMELAEALADFYASRIGAIINRAST